MTVDVDYRRPCKTTDTNDNFKAHVARGSSIPGLDYNCATGTKVFASADGTVIVTDEVAKDGTGISIQIKHADGNHTMYLHLSKILVKKGQQVKCGDTIALSGATGTTVTGPHLHFSIVDKHGKFIDPAKVLKKELLEARAEKKAEAADAAAPAPTTNTVV
jgi:murein DD-endopeptidase MepM/ murein hydrolase activator NlpD